jgi:adenylylsulfate reductase subunit A
MGAFLRNSLDERYMRKYHPMAEGSPRIFLVLGTYKEIMEGRGPCYVDCRHLSKQDLYHLKTNLLPVDKDTFMTFCEQKGLRLEKDLLEIEVSEMAVAGITGSVSGIVIDQKGKTTQDRLYAAGACTVPSFGISGALATGYGVGIEAAKSSLKISNVERPDEEKVRKEIQSIYAPLRRKEGVPYKELENKLRQIMADYVGYIKTERGLRTGIEKLGDLERKIDEMRVENYHELMRATEFKDLLLLGKLVAIGALKRKESRMGLSHLRGDYPNQDDKNFFGSMILKKKKGGIKVSFKPAQSNPMIRS